MLVDRYEAEDVFSRVPRMAGRIDPVLSKLDQLLDDDELYQQVRSDFSKRYRYTLVHGRHSTPVEVILRMLICKHLHQWSYQETEEQVDQNLILRWFCRLYWAPVPDESTLVRWANTLQPEPLHTLNDRVVELARKAKVTRGRKLRLDATCVQTTIHHPTDSGLLVDSVRVLSRFVQRAKPLIKEQMKNGEQACRSRLRTARRTAQTLHRQLRRTVEEKEAQQKELYQQLIQTAEQMVRQSRQVISALGERTEQQARRLLNETQQVLPLVERVIAQTRTRVLEEKKLASGKTGAQPLRAAYACHPTPQRRCAGRVWPPRHPGRGRGRHRDALPDPGAPHRAWTGAGGGRAPPANLCASAGSGGGRPGCAVGGDRGAPAGSRGQVRGDPGCR
jgi:IS5 family transposase